MTIHLVPSIYLPGGFAQGTRVIEILEGVVRIPVPPLIIPGRTVSAFSSASLVGSSSFVSMSLHG